MSIHYIVPRTARAKRRWSVGAAMVMAGVFAPAARAQGNLSQQGLGYPPGQVSTRALGAAGALAEIDPMSQVNPTSLSFAGSTLLFFQIEPEFRSVTSGNTTDKTMTARYPLFLGAIPVGTRWVVAFSSATLLDRTWSTATEGEVVVDGQPVSSTLLNSSDGSINDLRLAGSFMPAPWVRVGLGGHLMSGSDRVTLGRTFDDPAFGGFADTTILGFDGGAISGGVAFMAPRLAIATASFRKGAKLNADRSDTTLGSAHVPDRLGFSVAYIGIANTQIAARASWDKWSALNGLRTTGTEAVDGWDTSVGADVAGPRLGRNALMLRAGVRWRTLPYEADGHKVQERSLTGGLGTTFGGGRVLTDIAIWRAHRTAGIGVSESAWTLSIGLGVRP